MPPRKRKTKINTRAKPKAPIGDEGKSLTEQERRAKLDVFLKDYDSQVKSHLKKMEEKIYKLTRQVTGKLKTEIMQLPQQVREMTVNDFIAAGGTKDAAVEYLQRNSDNNTASISRSGSRTPWSSTLVRTISQKRPNLLRATIIEEESASPTPTQNRRRAAASRTAAKKKQLLQESSVYRPSSALNPSIKQKYMTPAQRSMAMSGWDTPLITPKFDPKLPYTPAGVRDPKPGERLMSITGSPVANHADPSVRVTNKAVSLHLGDLEDMENVDIEGLEDQIKKMVDMFKQNYHKSKQ